ncbi:OmpA family protein [Cyclobacteriaceae bacterium]|nr:OmpA family protein [Cyclobacteriaceae bacterium]
MIKKISFILLLISSLTLLAQQEYSTTNKKAIKLYKTADQQIRNRLFDEGLFNLEKALRIDREFAEARYLYAKTNAFMQFNKGSDSLVKFHYEIIYQQKPNDPKFIDVYYSLMKYEIHDRDFDKAKEYMTVLNNYPAIQREYGKEMGEYSRLIESALDAKAKGISIDLVKLPKNVNFSAQQFRPFFTGDESKIVFTVKNGMNEDIFYCEKDSLGNWSKPKDFGDNLNTKYNEGFATISADGRVMVYASTKPKGWGKSDLYVSYLENNEWTTPKNLGEKINSPGFDSEPALTADGRGLYYASTRDGGLGGKDIWYAAYLGDKEWSEAVNLGNEINTKGHEVTPFVHADNKYLFFASDSRDGLGGYDIYYAPKVDSLAFGEAVNLGYPINTEKQEGSLVINLDYSQAYMDVFDYQGRYSTCFIYTFKLPETVKSQHKSTYAKGFVYDEKTKQPLAAEVKLIDVETNKVVQNVQSDAKTGEFLIVLHDDKPYAFQIQKAEYLFFSKKIDFTSTELAAVEVDAPLVSISSKSQSVVLENIYFESKKYALLDQSKAELDQLVKTMKENPSLRLLVEGHTDNVGSEDYNTDLSFKRAQAVVAYLVENGIESSRLNAKGFGEAKPRTTNNTNAGRALNRRIEITIR